MAIRFVITKNPKSSVSVTVSFAVTQVDTTGFLMISVLTNILRIAHTSEKGSGRKTCRTVACCFEVVYIFRCVYQDATGNTFLRLLPITSAFRYHSVVESGSRYQLGDL